jgi:hypothetical protein
MLGALPPSDNAWQMGKSAGSISFVSQAEQLIKDLQQQIESIKLGEEIIMSFYSCVGCRTIE